MLCVHVSGRYFAYADNKEGTNGGHGTHVCGTVGGYPAQMSATSSAFKYQGMAYKAKVSRQAERSCLAAGGRESHPRTLPGALPCRSRSSTSARRRRIT